MKLRAFISERVGSTVAFSAPGKIRLLADAIRCEIVTLSSASAPLPKGQEGTRWQYTTACLQRITTGGRGRSSSVIMPRDKIE